jgi:hypothetical protein
MKSLIKISIWVLILFVLSTCQKDDPTNPFDPDTPKSIWTPSNFTATQNNSSVNLTWIQKEKNIDGFKIDRKVGGLDWSNVATLQETATSWTDNNLTGGETHQYRLYAYAGDNHSNEVTASITPLITATVNILPATNIEPNSATINGNVNANGSSTTVTFLYKPGSSSEWISIDANPKTVTGNTQTAVKANLSDLTPGEEYAFKIKAVNSSGEVTSDELTFNTTCNLPTASLSGITNLEQTSVTLNGKVSANGASTQVKFEYGETTDYGTSVNASPETVTQNNVNVSVNLTELQPEKTYYYKLVATNCGGTVEKESSFTTVTDCVQPTIGTLSTSDITVNSVTLKGQVNPNGKSTTVVFEYGNTTNYGKTVTATTSPISGSSLTNVSASVTSLQPCTNYYFRIKAENCGGTTTSSSSSFIMLGTKPETNILAASSVTNNSVQLNGQVNAIGSSTTVIFEYGTTTSYGKTVTAANSPIEGTSLTNVSASVTGLQSCTKYYYRIKAENCGGTTTSSSSSFTTSGTLPSATTLAATNITNNSATLNAQVNANGSPTTVTFVYYSMPGDYKTVTATPSTVTGTNTVNVSTNITGLSEGLLYTFHVVAENCAGTTNGTNENFTTAASPSSFVKHIGISKTNINLTNLQTVGQITINPSVAGQVIVTFDGDCTSSPGDRILLAASNTTSIGVNDAHVSLEATNSDLNENSFSHTRAYSVSAGSNTFYALAEQSKVEYDGSGIASIYGSLTVEFIPTSTSLVGFTKISQTNVNLTNKTPLGTVTINPSVSGKAIVRFTGMCLSSPGDRIILAAGNTTNWGTDDGAVGVEAINSDLNRNPFSHTRVYNVTAGSKTFYAIGHNYVEYDGDGIASIYGSLTVEFIPDINTRSFAVFTGIRKTNVNLSSSTVLSQLTINPAVSGKVLVRFDGSCISSPGDKIILAASNTTNWGTNDGNVSMEAYNSDINSNSFSHTRVYSVTPGSRTFYAIGHNYVETDGTGIASVYGSLTVIFFPDE